MLDIVGITKVRNEEHLIEDTLDHFLKFCRHVIVYDDVSDDRTVELCDRPNVTLIRGEYWNPDRLTAEYQNRQTALLEAQKLNPEWIICFDADERIEMPDIDYSQHDGVKMRLFDFYITPEDVDKHYSERKYIGKEYREILMMFRNLAQLSYKYSDQREMKLPPDARIAYEGYVKHYGKAISVEEWEKTCEYYSKWEEPYKSKWESRRGRAVHMVSDFGTELITWDDRDKGIKLI